MWCNWGVDFFFIILLLGWIQEFVKGVKAMTPKMGMCVPFPVCNVNNFD